MLTSQCRASNTPADGDQRPKTRPQPRSPLKRVAVLPTSRRPPPKNEVGVWCSSTYTGRHEPTSQTIVFIFSRSDLLTPTVENQDHKNQKSESFQWLVNFINMLCERCTF